MSNLKELNIGFIGFGNMAQAMAHGLLKTKALEPGQIFACARDWEKLCRNTETLGMIPCRSAEETVRKSDLVVIAVKPYLVREVTAPLKELLYHRIVVSVAAGCPFETCEEYFLPGTHHISTLPNTPVSIGDGILICEERHSLSTEEYKLFTELFSHLGLVQPVETSQLSIAGTISGCGPAFVSMFLEALADGAVMHGLPRELAYRLASQMAAGTGKLQLNTGSHPGVMKDAVCSPGGTTIRGVAALERGGLRAAVIDAIDSVESF